MSGNKQRNIQVENPPAILPLRQILAKAQAKAQVLFEKEFLLEGSTTLRDGFGVRSVEMHAVAWGCSRSLEAFPFSPNWQLLPRTQLHEGVVVQCIWKGRAELSCGLLVATCGNTWDILIRIIKDHEVPMLKSFESAFLQGCNPRPSTRATLSSNETTLQTGTWA